LSKTEIKNNKEFLMAHLAELLQNFPAIDNGACESRLKEVLFFQETQPIPRRPMVYDPGICIVAQGHKIGYLGGRKFRYDANNYLVTSVTMPFECETFASPEEPVRGLYIYNDIAQLHDLIGRMGLQPPAGNGGCNNAAGQVFAVRDRIADFRSGPGAGNYVSDSLRFPSTGTLFTGYA
jgi:AraC-type transcriptional regulator N-terminus